MPPGKGAAALCAPHPVDERGFRGKAARGRAVLVGDGKLRTGLAGGATGASAARTDAGRSERQGKGREHGYGKTHGPGSREAGDARSR